MLWNPFRALDLIIKELRRMSLQLADLQAAVAAETEIDKSVETLLTTLADKLSTANDAGDQSAIDAIVQQMRDNASALGAAVTANTPASDEPADPNPPAGGTV